VNEFRKFYERKVGERSVLQTQGDNYSSDLSQAQKNHIVIENAQVVIQVVAKNTQEQLKFHIEDLVTKALEAVFPEPYKFRIQFELKRGQTEAVLQFLREGDAISPATASGGGAVDVAAFALRVALWAIGMTDNTIVLDEPFRYLSRELQPKAGEMMRELSSQLDLQFIMVTHNADLEEIADRVFKVKMTNGKTVVLVA